MRDELIRRVTRFLGMAAIDIGVLAMLGTRPLAAQRCPGCAAEDTVPRTHILPGFGVHVGTPEKASVTLGVVLGEEWQQNGRDHTRNVALLGEAGLGAGRASIAYLRHGYGSFGSGFGIAGAVLRTWRDPWTVRENMTYAGGELILWPIVFVGPRIGLFHSVAGSGATRPWFVSFDFGIGL